MIGTIVIIGIGIMLISVVSFMMYFSRPLGINE